MEMLYSFVHENGHIAALLWLLYLFPSFYLPLYFTLGVAGSLAYQRRSRAKSSQASPLPKKCWAVVTGASRGLGRQISHELAKKGYNMVIMARSEDLLKELATELKERNVQVIVVPIDLARLDASSTSDMDALRKEIEHRDNIDVLVHNAGAMQYDFLSDYATDDRRRKLQDVVNLACSQTALLTSVILPKMVQQGYGKIGFVGSMAGSVPAAGLATYAASKAYLQSFAQGLQEECRQKSSSISVTYYQPGGITSPNFFNSDNPERCSFQEACPEWFYGSRSLEEAASIFVPALMSGDAYVTNWPVNVVWTTLTPLLPRSFIIWFHSLVWKDLGEFPEALVNLLLQCKFLRRPGYRKNKGEDKLKSDKKKK